MVFFIKYDFFFLMDFGMEELFFDLTSPLTNQASSMSLVEIIFNWLFYFSFKKKRMESPRFHPSLSRSWFSSQSQSIWFVLQPSKAFTTFGMPVNSRVKLALFFVPLWLEYSQDASDRWCWFTIGKIFFSWSIAKAKKDTIHFSRVLSSLDP